MEAGDVGALVRETMLVVLKLGGPPLLTGLVVGMGVSLLQAITQVHEPIVAFVPKVAAIGIALMLMGGFMLVTLTDFMSLIADRMIAGIVAKPFEPAVHFRALILRPPTASIRR